MDNDLGFLAKLVTERSERVRQALDGKRGRGSTFASVFDDVCDALSQVAADASATNPTTPRELEVTVRGLLRAKQQLDTLYGVVAHFEADVGRRDLPIGLLYLIDEIVRDLLPHSADPLVHLDDRYMYSTLPILETLPGLLKPQTISHPHPVAFNLPGLDPENVMFAPILAHEVGHTSWRQATASALDAQVDQNAVTAALNPAVAAGVDAAELAETCRNWAQELMCDALAATLTGPSFLFASAVFLPAPGTGPLNPHPYERDRIALTLRILERYDWMATVERLAPNTLAWCQGLAANPELSGQPAETALRTAMDVIEPAMLNVAEAQCASRLKVEDFQRLEHELFEHLASEIPPADLTQSSSSPWMTICGSWFHEISSNGDEPSALATISTDPRVNRFALKTVELAAVAAFWRGHESAAS